MSTYTQIQMKKLPGYEEEIKKDILAEAKNLYQKSKDDYIPADIELADLSEGEKAAIQKAYAGVGSYLPMMQAGSDTIGTGIDAYNKALDYSALGIPTIGASMKMYDPTSYKGFMDPYTEDVIKQTEKDLARQQDIQQQKLDAGAVGAGAFGGSRAAVADRELARDYSDRAANLAAKLRSTGFQQAQKQAQSAFEAQQRRLQGAGRLYGALGQGIGSLAGGMTKSGLAQSALGEAQQRAMMGDLGMLAGYGGLERQYNQAGLDAYRTNLMNRQMEPYRQLGFYADMLSGVPSTSTTYGTTYQPPPSPMSQIAGIGLGLGGLQQSGYFDGGLFSS